MRIRVYAAILLQFNVDVSLLIEIFFFNPLETFFPSYFVSVFKARISVIDCFGNAVINCLSGREQFSAVCCSSWYIYKITILSSGDIFQQVVEATAITQIKLGYIFDSFTFTPFDKKLLYSR